MIYLVVFLYAIGCTTLYAEEKSVDIASPSSTSSIPFTEEDEGWVEHVPEEFRKYIPKSVRKGTSNGTSDGTSWKKYVPSNYRHYVPGMEGKYEKHEKGAVALDADQESFSLERHVKGSARLRQCSFRRAFSTDTLDAMQCSFQDVTVNGHARMRESSVQGDFIVKGSLEAYALVVQGNLHATATTLRLRSSNVQGSIIIHDTPENPATLYIDKGTVSGDIIFKSGKGTIMQRGKVTIEGNIIGVSQ